MWGIAIIIISFIILTIYFSLSGIEKEKDVDAQITEWVHELENFSITSELKYSSSTDNTCCYIYIDEINKQLAIVHSFPFMFAKKYVINFKDIIGMEMKEDGITTNGVGRAVIGGALFGDVGAIVGSNTGKELIKFLKIILYLNSISNPIIEIELNKIQVKRNDYSYQKKLDFARKVDGTIRAIVNQNNVL